MSDQVLGVIAIILGVLFCFGGYWALRGVISLWGALAGFSLGAGLVAAINNEALLAGVLGWVVGLVLAVIFATFAYLYYNVAVILTMGSVGFAVGASVATALGLTWGWLITLIGLALGILIALLSLAMNLPAMLLMFLSAAGGATVAVAGLMLTVGAITRVDLAASAVLVRSEWWWYALYFVLLVAGLMAQARSVNSRARMDGTWNQAAPQA